MHLGLDFGTTNSALAVVDGGDVELVRFPTQAGDSAVFRSILAFDPDVLGPDNRAHAFAGPGAVDAWLKTQGAGRLVQSVKSHLASRSFTSTMIFLKSFALEDLVALLLQRLVEAAEQRVGELPKKVTLGRPVRFVKDVEADEEADAFAEQRLLEAVRRAGFEEVELELEPVAAAYKAGAALDGTGLVLVGDFGGGTSDFCVVEMGSGSARRGRDRVRATAGVPAAGDVLDQRILEAVVAPWLGKGSKRSLPGGTADVPPWLYGHLSRWHLLSFLKTKKTMALLDELVRTAEDEEALQRFHRLVDEDLGFSLFRAVERAKVALSTQERARLVFEDLDLDVEIERADFERWIEPDVARFAEAVDLALQRAGVEGKDVDRVFLTGGTSLVPAVRRVFLDRFDEGVLAGGDELTSVAAGLALVARDRADGGRALTART